MRLVYLMMIVGLLLVGAAYAQTEYTEVLYPSPFPGYTGENWISLRAVPFDPDPLVIFGNVGLIDDGRLQRLDPTTGNPESYLSFDPDTFGNMLLGEGYKVFVGDGQQHVISYMGAPDGLKDSNNAMTDMWISLPGLTGQEGGLHWVGFPFNHNVLWTDVLVTDGTETLPVLTAIQRGWLQGYWMYIDAPNQNPMQVDPDGIAGSPYLEAGRTYEVITFKSNLALIIPAGEVEE